MIGNKFCECGEPATNRNCGANVCEFCFWCQTQLVKGGDIQRRAEPIPKPVVKKFPAWHRMVEAVRELHGNRSFWAQRDHAREKFLDLFRKRGAMPDKLKSK